MNYQRLSVASVIAALILIVSGFNTFAVAQEGSQPAEVSETPSAFFDILSNVLTGTWEGQFTFGTFENPTIWSPVRVEYRLAASGTAIIEEYSFDVGPGMTTVYLKDNNDLRATHYCAAGNHPRMIAQDFDMLSRTVGFEFVDVTNLTTPDSYHSRQLILEIVDDDHVNITYHGLRDGQTVSQAYALTRLTESSN